MANVCPRCASRSSVTGQARPAACTWHRHRVERTRRGGFACATPSSSEDGASTESSSSGSSSPSSRSSGSPWSDKIGLYYTKRKTHKTGPLGEIADESYEDVLDPAGWNDDAKMSLAMRCVADELGATEEFVASRVAQLQTLVPDLTPKLETMKVADIARLAMKVPDLPSRLLALRETFPTANISLLASRRPGILLEDPRDVAAVADRLRHLLAPSSGEDVDSAVERNPTFLEVSQVETALSEIRRLMPNKDAARMLIASPDMLFSFQTGDDLIPYDNGSLKQLQATLRGGEGAAPPGW